MNSQVMGHKTKLKWWHTKHKGCDWQKQHHTQQIVGIDLTGNGTQSEEKLMNLKCNSAQSKQKSITSHVMMQKLNKSWCTRNEQEVMACIRRYREIKKRKLTKRKSPAQKCNHLTKHKKSHPKKSTRPLPTWTNKRGQGSHLSHHKTH
jgi:hypothetical protein